MAGEYPPVVDEAAAIAGEGHPLRHRMQVSEWIDAVPTRHAAVSRDLHDAIEGLVVAPEDLGCNVVSRRFYTL